MSPPTAPRMRWWGWGVDGHDRPLSSAVERLLRAELHVGDVRRRPAALADVALPEARLDARVRDGLTAVVGPAHVRDDRLARITHAVGKGYADLVRVRAGRLDAAPDAVVCPGTHDEVAGVLELCAREGVAVVPFGGGTSVVGGVEALRGPFPSVVSVDLGRLDGLRALDLRSGLATLDAGVVGPRAEALLGAHGLTLGHFPQSFEYSTVGGWVATRSAGQASTGYGRIDELVAGVALAAPAGVLAPRTLPASAAGPDLRELVLGSEGALGIVTHATLRVRPRPAVRRYEAWGLPTFAAGAEALREVAQSGTAPAVARLSDAEETRLNLVLAGGAAPLLGRYLRARGQRRPCLAVIGYEGPPATVRRRRAHVRRALRRHGARALGAAPGRSWERGRFAAPYVRDALLGRGVMVDTLETATTWSNLDALHHAVGAALGGALAARGTPPAVGCHISHLYPTGASLYFTFLARQQEGAELEQWNAAKAAASDAIVAGGGTITHHHGVGRDHEPWLSAEIGELGVEVLRAARGRLDPAGIMNPGKLTGPGERAP